MREWGWEGGREGGVGGARVLWHARRVRGGSLVGMQCSWLLVVLGWITVANRSARHSFRAALFTRDPVHAPCSGAYRVQFAQSLPHQSWFMLTLCKLPASLCEPYTSSVRCVQQVCPKLTVCNLPPLPVCRYELAYNQEIVGLGIANFAGAAFSSYTTTGSFSRSAVNNASGECGPGVNLNRGLQWAAAAAAAAGCSAGCGLGASACQQGLNHRVAAL
jgi:hypothetical protein